MTTLTPMLRRFLGLKLLAVMLAAMPISAAQAGEASGALTHQARSGPVEVRFKHAYLVAGPNFENRQVRLLVLSEEDLASAIQGCDRLGCVPAELMAGATVEFDAGPRFGYWFVANGQRVQHSGTSRQEQMNLTQDSPQRLAGEWTLPGGGSGPSGSVKFDASLLKTFGKP